MVVSVSVHAGDRGQHQHLGLCRDVGVEQPGEVGHRVMAGFVHQHGGEATNGHQLVLVQGGGQLVGVGGQEPVGAEFGCGQPKLAHLGQNLLRPELVSLARNLAHSPRNRGSGNAIHDRTSSILIGRC